jgi:protein-L-isoaspartate(D-aspartate) O-methyltransferase
MNFEQARFNMVEQQIRPWDVLDQHVLDLLMSLKREQFVPKAHTSLAFSDTEIALTTGGRVSGECMLAPRVEARILQELTVTKTDRILEIGAGSGYMAALLARMGGSVLTVEINPKLANLARSNLMNASINNVDVLEADGSKLELDETFDVIALSGSIDYVNDALLKLLRPNGRLAVFVGKAPAMTAQILRKSIDGSIVSETLFETDVPRLRGFATHSEFVF